MERQRGSEDLRREPKGGSWSNSCLSGCMWGKAIDDAAIVAGHDSDESSSTVYSPEERDG